MNKAADIWRDGDKKGDGDASVPSLLRILSGEGREAKIGGIYQGSNFTVVF